MGKSGLFRVSGTSLRSKVGYLCAGGRRFACALGRSGRKARKREGDGATPIGSWRPVEVLYRGDRMLRPRTCLPARELRRDDGWCDAVGDRSYNRAVTHPYPASAERLWRDDSIYDLVVVLDHNLQPRIRGGGSAIFMHAARPGFAPTEGCIALRLRDLRQVVSLFRRRSRIVVVQ